MQRLFSLLYHLALCLAAIVALPRQLIKGKKWTSRWGRGFSTVQKDSRPLIWIHAVSVGETKAISTLAALLKQKHPDARFLVTSVTATGHEEAKRSLPFADHFLFLPFDFSWIIEPIVKRLQPAAVLFSETDYWYHFARAAKSSGAHIALINGKISKKSFQRFHWFHRWTGRYFAPVDQFCVQNKHYAERFFSLGIPPEKIHISGNLKLDAPSNPLSSEDKAHWQKRFGIAPETFVIVAGSTHPSEEELIVETFHKLAKDHPHLKLLIAPRHPERFEQVFQLLQNSDYSSSRFTQSKPAQIILIDAMGMLQTCYQLASLAIVGGSFHPKIGGHNIIEPCAFGIPVVFGPYMHNQPDLVQLIGDYQAGLQTTQEKLCEDLSRLLASPILRQTLGKQGLKLTQDAQGASQRVCKLLEEKLTNLRPIIF
jgi:3-deoxy-D-manno-octulosonic-acid transferase